MALRQILKKAGSPLNFLKRVITPTKAASSPNGTYGTPATGKKHFSATSVDVTKGFHTTSSRKNEFVFNIQDQKDFQKRVLDSKTPIIIDFYATWCGPCKLLVPKLEQIVAKKKGEVILAKVDIDHLTEIADSFEVTAVPTVVAVRNGKQVDKFVGLKDDAELETFINKLIK